MSKKNKGEVKSKLCPRCYSKIYRISKLGKTLEDKEKCISYINEQTYVNGCACCGYVGPTLDIDVKLESVISMLNKRGYRTLNCCQGHINNHGHVVSTPYIMFSPDIVHNEKELKEFEDSLPESWYIDNDPYIIQPGIIIRGDMIYHKNYINDIILWASYIFKTSKLPQPNITNIVQQKYPRKERTCIGSSDFVNMINDVKKDNNDKEEFLGQIIDCFEDFLDEKKVAFNNPERDEAIADGNDSTAIIYGSDYDKLSECIESILDNWNLI